MCKPCTLFSRVFLIISSSVFLKHFGFTCYILPINERKITFYNVILEQEQKFLCIIRSAPLQMLAVLLA